MFYLMMFKRREAKNCGITNVATSLNMAKSEKKPPISKKDI